MWQNASRRRLCVSPFWRCFAICWRVRFVAEISVFLLLFPRHCAQCVTDSLTSVRYWNAKVSVRDAQRYVQGGQVLWRLHRLRFWRIIHEYRDRGKTLAIITVVQCDRTRGRQQGLVWGLETVYIGWREGVSGIKGGTFLCPFPGYRRACYFNHGFLLSSSSSSSLLLWSMLHKDIRQRVDQGNGLLEGIEASIFPLELTTPKDKVMRTAVETWNEMIFTI